MQYDFNLAANGAQFIDVAGRFFKYKAGLGPIRVRISTGGYVDLLPGQGVDGVEFSSLSVADNSGLANKGVLLAGDYAFKDDRISGTVDVVDGGKARTLAGAAFYTTISQAPSLGNASLIELWNPVGSPKNLVVKGYGFQVDVATSIAVRACTSSLATMQGYPPSKKLGGTYSISEARVQAGGAATSVAFYPGASMLAGSSYDKVLQEPIVITPGNGLLFVTTATNVNLIVNIEFIEEAI